MQNRFLYIALCVLLILFTMGSYIPCFSNYLEWVTPPVVLFIGLIFGLFIGQPFPVFNKKMSKYLLQYSVVGLGFGMNLVDAIERGKDGMLFTIVSVFGTLLIGYFIGRKVLNVDKNTSYLVSVGTAICGGSAIATVGPIINAKEEEMTLSLASVFVLNAVALFLFPFFGEILGLTQIEFGTWSAIAIHDTSSVVGAASAFGEEALQVATTVKLTRALWIILVAFFTMFLFRSKGKKIVFPYFILFFVLAMLINTFLLSRFDWGVEAGEFVSGISRRCLTLTMFFIGASLSPKTIRAVGLRSMLLALILWLVISAVTLLYIKW